MPRHKARATSMGSGRQRQSRGDTRISAATMKLITDPPKGTPRKRRFFVLRYTDEQKYNWYAQTVDPLTGLPKQWTTAQTAAYTWTTEREAAAIREATLTDWREKMGMMMPMPAHYPHVYIRTDQDWENESIVVTARAVVIEHDPEEVTPRKVTIRKRTSARKGEGRAAAGGSDLRGDRPNARQRKGVQPVADTKSVRKSKKRVGKQSAATPSKATRKRVSGSGSVKKASRKPVRKQGRTGANGRGGKASSRGRK